MAAKTTAALITLLINLAIGVAVFFGMLIAMNGYSGSDAEWGLIAYIVLAVGASILMSFGAFFGVAMLLKRQFRGRSRH